MFNNHLLSLFGVENYRTKYIIVDTQTGDISSIQANACAVNEDYSLTNRQGDSGGTYVLQLFYKWEPLLAIEVALPNWYLNASMFEGSERLALSLADNRTATLSGHTITYMLDFNNESYEVLRHYSTENFDNLAASNDRWAFYNANRGRFEGGYWGEVVVHDKHTGEFSFFHDRYAYSAAISKTDMVLINEVWGLALFDINEINEMKIVKDILRQTDDNPLDRVISGVAYDSEKDWFVVAWLPLDNMYLNNIHSYEYGTNIIIGTYSTNGELLRSFDSGVEMQMYPFLYSILELELVLDGEGNALFRIWSENSENEDGFESVRYWD